MGDLQVGENFRDRCRLIVIATGLEATGLADVTCTIYDEGGVHNAGTVAELSHGWYEVTDFTPDAAGTWHTEWSKTAVPANYYFYYPFKLFKVGGGEVTDVKTDTVDIHTDVGDVHTDVGTAITDIGAVHTHINDIHDTDLPDLHTDVADVHTDVADVHTDVADVHTDVGTVITAAGTAAAYAIVNSGQSFRGAVTAIPGANQFTIGTLAGLGAGIFIDANTPWYAYVLRDNGGLAAAPQGETRLITAYVTATGAFTTTAFSSAVEAGDDMIIMSAYLSSVTDIHTVIDNLHDTDIPDIHTDVGTAITAIGDMHATDLPDLHTDVGTVHTDVDAVRARTDRLEITKAFFGPCLIAGTVDTTHTDIALGSVTLPNIAGTITHVYAGFKFRMIENTNVAANKLNGAQEIQVDTVDAINFVDHQFGVAASTREGGDCIIGAVDLVATVDVFNHAYAFVWDEPLSEVDSLVFNDIQPFLIVSYY